MVPIRRWNGPAEPAPVLLPDCLLIFVPASRLRPTTAAAILDGSILADGTFGNLSLELVADAKPLFI